MNWLRRVSPALPALYLALSSACANPFSTRTPEEPDANPSSFITPTTPDIVFVNLQLAIREGNVENYMRSFVDTTRSQNRFAFVPDRGVAANHPGVFSFWQLDDERRYVTKLFQATPGDSLRSLQFVEQSRTESVSTASFTQNYVLVFRHRRQADGLPVEYRGQAIFRLEKSQTGDWAIFHWEDFANERDPSWTELKALFQ